MTASKRAHLNDTLLPDAPTVLQRWPPKYEANHSPSLTLTHWDIETTSILLLCSPAYWKQVLLTCLQLCRNMLYLPVTVYPVLTDVCCWPFFYYYYNEIHSTWPWQTVLKWLLYMGWYLFVSLLFNNKMLFQSKKCVFK